jgi:hypothetical protein
MGVVNQKVRYESCVGLEVVRKNVCRDQGTKCMRQADIDGHESTNILEAS